MKATWLLSLVGILAILFVMQQSNVEGFTTSPRTAPLSTFQSMFNNAGCRRQLVEGDVWWWRARENMDIVQNDMNEYARLTRSCIGDDRQHTFCDPGKCTCGWAR